MVLLGNSIKDCVRSCTKLVFDSQRWFSFVIEMSNWQYNAELHNGDSYLLIRLLPLCKGRFNLAFILIQCFEILTSFACKLALSTYLVVYYSRNGLFNLLNLLFCKLLMRGKKEWYNSWENLVSRNVIIEPTPHQMKYYIRLYFIHGLVELPNYANFHRYLPSSLEFRVKVWDAN